MRPFLPLAIALLALGGCSLLAPDPVERAREAYAAQDYFGAREQALLALQANPADGDALHMLARIQLAMGAGTDVLVTLERMEEADVSSPDVALLRAEALLQTGQIEAAVAALEGEENAEAWRLRALAAINTGDAEAAAAHFLAGRDADGDRRKLFTAEATFHLNRGNADGARFAVGQAQRLAPNAIETLFVSARLAELDNRPDLASRAYLAILERTPNDRPALLGAVRELDKLGRMDLFEPLIARGRAAYPLDIEFLYLDASLRAYRGDWEGTRSLLQQREAAVGEHDNARGLYAQALLELGQYEQARAQIAPLNRRYPNNAAYARIYARILLALGENAQARRAIAPILQGADASDADRELAERAAG